MSRGDDQIGPNRRLGESRDADELLADRVSFTGPLFGDDSEADLFLPQPTSTTDLPGVGRTGAESFIPPTDDAAPEDESQRVQETAGPYHRTAGAPSTGASGSERDGSEAADSKSTGIAPAAYSVGQVSNYIRELLETDAFLSDVWLSGEVTNYSRSQAGHVYFTLSDSEGALRCVFFRQHSLGVAVEQGDAVLVHGRVSIYGARGELQLYVDSLQPEGMGVLEAEFQRLMEQLKAEGLFDPNRKRALPRYPRTVGVVTSATGAVWHDIQTVMKRRWPMAGLLLSPSLVQGDRAARSIVAAIENLNRVAADFDDVDLDVIIVGRGGGSAEDLWAFNDERVARAIYSSEIPIISAVGHETDHTIADYVADLRAATPSAAAELAARSALIWARSSIWSGAASGRALSDVSDAAQTRLRALTDRLDQRAPDLDHERQRLDGLIRDADARVSQLLQANQATLRATSARLAALDPRATLSRGYAIVQDAQGHIVDSAAGLSRGAAVQIQFHDGTVDADVTNVDSPATPKKRG
jgi:exodeoxyribonuclease VII large subunit